MTSVHRLVSSRQLFSKARADKIEMLTDEVSARSLENFTALSLFAIPARPPGFALLQRFPGGDPMSDAGVLGLGCFALVA